VRLEKYEKQREYHFFLTLGKTYPDVGKNDQGLIYQLPRMFESGASKIDFSTGIAYAGTIAYEISQDGQHAQLLRLYPFQGLWMYGQIMNGFGSYAEIISTKSLEREGIASIMPTLSPSSARLAQLRKIEVPLRPIKPSELAFALLKRVGEKAGDYRAKHKYFLGARRYERPEPLRPGATTYHYNISISHKFAPDMGRFSADAAIPPQKIVYELGDEIIAKMPVTRHHNSSFMTVDVMIDKNDPAIAFITSYYRSLEAKESDIVKLDAKKLVILNLASMGIQKIAPLVPFLNGQPVLVPIKEYFDYFNKAEHGFGFSKAEFEKKILCEGPF
jgi:hypothetical protein